MLYGFDSSAATTHRFYSAGSEVMRLSGAGNVGIGTTNATGTLEVYGASQTTAALTDAGVKTGILALNSSGTAAGNGGTITFGNSQSIAAGSIGFAAIKGLLTSGASNTFGDLAFSTRNATTDTALTERLRVVSNGRVGIGTTVPGYQLDVRSASNTTIHLSGDVAGAGTRGGLSTDVPVASAFYSGSYSNHPFILGTNNAERLRISADGNVGIGNASPAGLLHVGADPTRNFQISANALLTARYDNNGYNAPLTLENRGMTAVGHGAAVFFNLATGGGAGSIAGAVGVQTENATFTGATADSSLVLSTVLDANFNERMRVTSAGNVGIGTSTPQSALHVPDGRYAQFEDFNAGAPLAADCDADTERGRQSIDTTNFRLYICMGATRGWDYVALTN